MGAHLIDGEFQSDKYPTTPRGKVPLSVKDATAQDLLWEYAQRRRKVDAEFSDDLETALKTASFEPPPPGQVDRLRQLAQITDLATVQERVRVIEMLAEHNRKQGRQFLEQIFKMLKLNPDVPNSDRMFCYALQNLLDEVAAYRKAAPDE